MTDYSEEFDRLRRNRVELSHIKVRLRKDKFRRRQSGRSQNRRGLP